MEINHVTFNGNGKSSNEKFFDQSNLYVEKKYKWNIYLFHN